MAGHLLLWPVMKRAKNKAKTSQSNQPLRSRDVPATAGMIYELRDEIIKRFEQVDARVEGLEKSLKADIHQQKILMEEQNARNIFVIDQMNSLFHRQERVEKKLDGSF